MRRDGALVAATRPPPDATFAVELKAAGSGLALRDRAGRYLTAVGRDAVVQGRNASAGKDELFAVEEGHPQVVILAHNGKMVSIKQGLSIFTARRYASAVLGVGILSVCPSVTRVLCD